MPLTHSSVTNAKPSNKIIKLSDGGGLYLQIKPTGYKCWKYDYRINKKRGTFTVGQYPDISLKKAREIHRDARELVALGISPMTMKVESRTAFELDTKRFSYYAEHWLAKQNFASSTFKDLKQRIDKNLIPYLDVKKVNEFSTLDLFNVLKRISNRGSIETAVRMAGVLRKIYNEILILGIVDNNPAQGIAELLPKPDAKTKGNFGHITDPKEVGILLKQIDNSGKKQDFTVTQALKLMPLVFLRPKNIRLLKWEYIDFNDRQINIPANEMKAGKPLSVPLSNQSIEILKTMIPLNGMEEYVFITAHGKTRTGLPLSESTTTKALQRLINPATGKPFGTGYMTSHGFRHMASTLLNEMGYDSDVIELQLAHISKDRIRATYNKAQLMDKRVEMMQEWADYLDDLRNE